MAGNLVNDGFRLFEFGLICIDPKNGNVILLMDCVEIEANLIC